MAKKKKRTRFEPAATKKTSKRLEPVGWLFWLISFAVLVPPGIFAAWTIAFKTTIPAARVGIGVLLAAVGSACISVAANFVIDHIDKKRQQAARKKAKKNRKK